MIYIITLVRCDDGIEIGKQNIRHSWESAVNWAVKTAMQATVFDELATTADKRAVRREIKTSLEDGGTYVTMTWTIFIWGVRDAQLNKAHK